MVGAVGQFRVFDRLTRPSGWRTVCQVLRWRGVGGVLMWVRDGEDRGVGVGELGCGGVDWCE